MLSVRPLIPPFLDFWGCLHWVSKSEWIPSSACFIACAQQIPRIHLLAENMAAELFHPHTCLQVLVGLMSRIKCSAASQHVTRQTFHRLSHAGSASGIYSEL